MMKDNLISKINLTDKNDNPWLSKKPISFLEGPKRNFICTVHFEMRAKKNRFNARRVPLIKPIAIRKKKIEKKFLDLADKWKEETGLYSTTNQKVNNPHYLEIIGMGKEVIPFIILDLKRGGGHWHTALYSITTENPVPEKDLSKQKMIRELWIQWANEKSYNK